MKPHFYFSDGRWHVKPASGAKPMAFPGFGGKAVTLGFISRVVQGKTGARSHHAA